MEIVINNPREFVIMPEKRATVDKITVLNVTDHGPSKIVTAFTREFGNIILWQDVTYDAIGQWTDQDVVDRLNELYNP